MFGTLLLKEIHETVITGKFVIAAFLCLFLIPLGMYVTLDDYQQRLADYNSAQQLYQQRSEGNVSGSFKAEGYRPPSPLSVFALGLDPFLPNKVITSRRMDAYNDDKDLITGIVNISNNSSLNNPLSVFFGKMDYLFNVAFVLSLLAFVFTFAGVSGEKEHGTLKLIMSNRVPRWMIILAKMMGNFIVFVLPFLVAFIVGILVLILSGAFPVTDPGIGVAVLSMLGISVLFLLCMLTLGILVSSSSRYTNTAIITLLFIWVAFALVIPKLSAMVAQKIHPVQSNEVVMQQIRIARNSLENELISREDELFDEFLINNGLTMGEFLFYRDMEEGKHYVSEYEAELAPIREEYANRLADVTTHIQRSHANEQAIQQGIAMQISRVSPISCFMYVLSAIASTGPQESDNFYHQAEQFQEQVASDIYDKFIYWKYGSAGVYKVGYVTEGDVEDIPVPHMSEYQFASLGDAFANTWPDLLLLGLYTVLFFAGAFVKFIRYDVR